MFLSMGNAGVTSSTVWFRVQGCEFRVPHSEQGFGLDAGFRVLGLRFRVWGLGFTQRAQ